MVTQQLIRKIDGVLFALLVFDVFVATIAFGWPDFWFQVIHGVPYNDPQGFLRRCGANWAAFALLQALALCRWKKASYWLVLVAGVRFSDVFTDWAYLWFASNVTLFGRVGLFLDAPANALLGWWMLRAYAQVNAAASNS